MSEKEIAFRAITADDMDFLRRVYADTRAHEMAIVPWTDEQKAAFLRQQFDAQHAYYQETCPAARYELILSDGQAIGRLYQDWRDDELRIIDIALLSEHRGQGIGGKIMRDLIDQAAAEGKKVTIHVEMNNPAMHLYDRLGFQKIEEQGVYWLMEWLPGDSSMNHE